MLKNFFPNKNLSLGDKFFLNLFISGLSESIIPGLIEFTRILNFPKSIAIDLVKPNRPLFAVS